MSDTPDTDAKSFIAFDTEGRKLVVVLATTSESFERERDEERAELAEWKILNLWGGTPEIVHAFIKGQQMRIWECQEIEKTCEQLERERDEARKDLDFRRDLFALQEKQLNEARASLDEIRKRADYNLDLAKKARDLWEECERERDEARNEIEGWRNKWECAVEMAAIAEVKKDEIIQKLKEILNNQ